MKRINFTSSDFAAPPRPVYVVVQIVVKVPVRFAGTTLGLSVELTPDDVAGAFAVSLYSTVTVIALFSPVTARVSPAFTVLLLVAATETFEM